MSKIKVPYLRAKGDEAYQCSACLEEFDGPHGRRGVGSEFAKHIKEKHSASQDMKPTSKKPATRAS